MKKRKAQSNLLVIVLLVLLVLAAIIIVWNIVIGILKNSSEDVKMGPFITSIEISQTRLFITGDVQIVVNMKKNSERLTSLKFIFYKNDGTTKTIEIRDNLPLDYESKSYFFNSSVISSSEIIRISVVPMFEYTSGMEVKESTNLIKLDNSGRRILETDSSGLVNWWKLDGNMLDSIGENDGSCINCPILTLNNRGEFDKAYYFNGINNSIDCGNNLTINDNLFSKDMSISVWVYPSSVNNTNYSSIIVYRDNSSSKHLFSLFSQGSSFGVRITNTGISKDTSFFNQWHHFVGTFNATSRKLSRFFDKDTIGDFTFGTTGIYKDPHYTTVFENIFCSIGGSGSYFNGSIANVMVFNRTLTYDEIVNIYNFQK